MSWQAAAIKTLIAGEFATEYAFLEDAGADYILGYIVISDLQPASSKRRRLLQAGTKATMGIPIPSGLDTGKTEALESGVKSQAGALAEAVASELGAAESRRKSGNRRPPRRYQTSPVVCRPLRLLASPSVVALGLSSS